MKKLILFFGLMMMVSMTSMAQKYAYINSNEILNAIPEYKAAQKELDDLSEKWQKEIEAMNQEIEKKDKAYQEEKILLPEETRKQRETEIAQLLRKVRDFQKAKYSPNGELYKKREELIKPIQDKMYKAVKSIAKAKNYAFVFDKGSQNNIVYADTKYDISDDVLKKLGVQ